MAILQHGLHLPNLGLLARDDGPAQLLDFRRLDGCLLAHEDGTCMVRDHRAQELPIGDGDLLPDQEEKPISAITLSTPITALSLVFPYISRINTSSISTM